MVYVDKAMGIQFPEEMLMDIFSRLHVQCLLRFKCVSKFWNTLISDPYFKMNHLNRAKKNHSARKFIASELYLNDTDMLSFRCSPTSSVELVEYVQKLDCPINAKPCRCRIYCYRDGLSLIGVRNDKHFMLLLWNPATRESVVLPDPEFPPEELCTFGLGYDSTSDDYKILKLDPKGRGEILALKCGSWKKIDKHSNGILPVLSGMDPLAFVNGAFHWLGLSLYDSVVSFNISNEMYGKIPVSKYMWLNPIWKCLERGISVLKGMLCAYSISISKGKEMFNLSVMKDYGNNESWSGLFVIQCTDIFAAIPGYKFADGEVIFNHSRRFDSVVRTSRGPFGLCPQCDSFKEGFVYTESLISPKLQYAQ